MVKKQGNPATKTARKINVDWPNQVIGFLGTILGIFIGLQLQDWYDARMEQKKVAETIQILRTELMSNRQILTMSIEFLTPFNNAAGAIVAYQKTDSSIRCSRQVFDSLRAIYPDNFPNRNIKGAPDEHPFRLEIGFILEDIHNTAWNAAKVTGLLTSFDQDRMFRFSRVYDTFDRNFYGATVNEFLQCTVKGNVQEIHSIGDKLIGNFTLKLKFAKPDLEEIEKY